MARNKENFNDKLGKWLAFGNELDTSKIRDLAKEEEENCIEIETKMNSIMKKHFKKESSTN